LIQYPFHRKQAVGVGRIQNVIERACNGRAGGEAKQSDGRRCKNGFQAFHNSSLRVSGLVTEATKAPGKLWLRFRKSKRVSALKAFVANLAAVPIEAAALGGSLFRFPRRQGDPRSIIRPSAGPPRYQRPM
jgi:hypothetical protein